MTISTNILGLTQVFKNGKQTQKIKENQFDNHDSQVSRSLKFENMSTYKVKSKEGKT